MTYSYARAYHRGIIKRLTPIEMPLFGPHLLRLSGECRRAYFGNEVADAFLKDYAQRVDASNTDVIRYLENGVMRGAAELRSLAVIWLAHAEMAFTVEPAWRRMGIGTALMQAAHSLARRRGLSEAFLIFHPHNVPMRRLAEKVDANLRFEDGDCVATIPVRKRPRIATGRELSTSPFAHQPRRRSP